MHFALSVVIHHLAYLADIYVHRAIPDTAAASGALNGAIVFVRIILELVHKALSHSLKLVFSWVVP